MTGRVEWRRDCFDNFSALFRISVNFEGIKAIELVAALIRPKSRVVSTASDDPLAFQCNSSILLGLLELSTSLIDKASLFNECSKIADLLYPNEPDANFLDLVVYRVRRQKCFTDQILDEEQ